MASLFTPQVERFERSFSAFSGANIVATFNGRHIAELQGITYSIAREKGPIFTMGSPDARAFGRGKRGISGSLIFQTFDREALMEELKKTYQNKPSIAKYQTFISNVNSFRAKYLGLDVAERGGELDIASVDDMITRNLNVDSGGIPTDWNDVLTWEEPEYNDQLPPFHISIAFANEEGRRARMEIFGVEILNEGMTMTVDDLSLEKAMTYVARRIKYIRPMDASGRKSQAGLEHAPSAMGTGVGVGY